MKLVLPPTVAVLKPEEAPETDPSAVEKIEEGFVVVHPDEPDRWTYYAKINVDAEKIWNVFETLARTLPDNVGPIIGFSNEEAALIPYADREAVMRVLRLFKKELVFDGFLEFGITNQSHTEIEEVWLTAEKFFKVWGRDEGRFRTVMADLGLTEIAGLRFVDEFAHSHSTLIVVDKSALHAVDVVDEVVERLNALSEDDQR